MRQDIPDHSPREYSRKTIVKNSNDSRGLCTNGWTRLNGGWKNSKNRLVDIRQHEQVVEYWPFFSQGLAELNATMAPGDTPVSGEVFLRLLFKVVHMGQARGRVTVLVNKNAQPLAFGIVYDNTEALCRRSAIVYAVYSNHQCPTAVTELREEAERWARECGYAELHAVSRRINGATFRIFERQWGFRRTAVIFKKEL